MKTTFFLRKKRVVVGKLKPFEVFAYFPNVFMKRFGKSNLEGNFISENTAFVLGNVSIFTAAISRYSV